MLFVNELEELILCCVHVSLCGWSSGTKKKRARRGVHIGYVGLGTICTQARGRKRPQHNIRTEEEESFKRSYSFFFFTYSGTGKKKDYISVWQVTHTLPNSFYLDCHTAKRSEDDETTWSSVIEKIRCWTVYSKYLDLLLHLIEHAVLAHHQSYLFLSIFFIVLFISPQQTTWAGSLASNGRLRSPLEEVGVRKLMKVEEVKW
ncbi:hypothetical protein GHT06_010148 [Daphnia sinensis]|uniref:Uncharacterized protein n=1 Tax=Daphnia sinensis TaxID=1820382 RepID=A0AAD5Q027_9CRUS|nr:hypothetical protein GHT06_010148 [Daphnia sinensis]